MTEKANPKKMRKSGAEPPRSAQPRINPAFDDWLEKKLHHIFDAAAMEPIPKDLLKLLEKLDETEGAPKKDKK